MIHNHYFFNISITCKIVAPPIIKNKKHYIPIYKVMTYISVLLAALVG